MNPGVITLASRNLQSAPSLRSKSLVIEDNIGEAIHIHYRNLRLDLTISEFFELSQVFADAAKNLARQLRIPIDEIDHVFLMNIAPYFGWVEKVKERFFDINELVIIEHNPEGRHLVSVSKCLAYQYLVNRNEQYVEYVKQYSTQGHSPDKLLGLLKSIRTNGYTNGTKIITFGDEPFIRDGMHRAACLLFLGKSKNIPVLNFRFKYDAPKDWMLRPK